MPRTSNVDVIRALYAAFARRDLPAVVAALSPDVRIDQSTELPWGGRYLGHAGMQEFTTKLVHHVASTVTVERFIDSGDRVVAIGRTAGTANATGKTFEVPIAHVWTLADGKVVAA